MQQHYRGPYHHSNPQESYGRNRVVHERNPVLADKEEKVLSDRCRKRTSQKKGPVTMPSGGGVGHEQKHLSTIENLATWVSTESQRPLCVLEEEEPVQEDAESSGDI